jgi:molybdenum cofactor cytidylyltransferase
VSLKANNSQIAAILLAAGGSLRLGQPKQLLIYKNEFLINYIIGQIEKGGITDINVILGSHFSEIENQIGFRNVKLFNNPDWKEGISSSIRTGVRNLDQNIQSAIFFIVDQPFLEANLVQKILEKQIVSKSKIIAVKVGEVITHPVLFRRELFPKLLDLNGDIGGKSLFKKYIPDVVVWDNKKLLIDIDTKEDYKEIIGK